MKSVLIFVFTLLYFSVFAQDRITKADGTIITGKVISFQSNRLSVLQTDETEIVLPRKAVIKIEFDIDIKKSSSEKSEPTVREYSTKGEEKMPTPKTVEAPVKPESLPLNATKMPIKNKMDSPGIISGLEERKLEYSEGFSEQAVGQGIVAVEVCLNTEGRVKKAKFKAVGSTTLDTDLISLAVRNAREFKFARGTEDECGIITYRFNID